jgi:hypothetical protein
MGIVNRKGQLKAINQGRRDFIWHSKGKKLREKL